MRKLRTAEVSLEMIVEIEVEEGWSDDFITSAAFQSVAYAHNKGYLNSSRVLKMTDYYDDQIWRHNDQLMREEFERYREV